VPAPFNATSRLISRKGLSGYAVRATLFEFRVAPATLSFDRVSDLKIALDYIGYAMGAFSIDGIERELRSDPTGFQAYAWRILVNFPRGEITFESTGFTQELRAEPRTIGTQSLSDAERTPL